MHPLKYSRVDVPTSLLSEVTTLCTRGHKRAVELAGKAIEEADQPRAAHHIARAAAWQALANELDRAGKNVED